VPVAGFVAVETPHVRRIAAAVALCLLIVGGFAVPTAIGAAPVQPKVAIIVGPVDSSTGYYKSDGDAAYAEALKYTPNVVRVYTPNATWAAAKQAMRGASIVIYMGHGNGFPSPYRSSPWPYSQNGLGLNPRAGGNNSTTQYYGEYYLAREVDLAPNAIVLLHHLCYASGNSESGKPKATLAQAKQRVDNMAAGWLKAGAAAVVAEGHFGPAWYVRQLFTTHKTVDQIFHDSPTFNDSAFSFASGRTPGATIEMDPDGTPGGYWRSVTGHLETPTDDITGAAYADTGTDPIGFEVPGAASVGVDGAPVYADPSLGGGGAAATTNLALGTRLRLTDRSSGTTPAGQPIFAIATLDGATSGWMSSADLVPRDSAAPVVWSADDGDGAFSPNGDGRGDGYTLTGRISETATWTVHFETTAGAILGTVTGSGDRFSATWAGIVDGTAVPDGTYRWAITVHDGWGNPDGTKSGTFVADTVAPVFDDGAVAAGAPGDVPTFSPNGDGSGDSIGLRYSTNERGYVDLTVTSAGGAIVGTFSTRVPLGPGRVSWDGLNDAGNVVPDGLYTVRLAPRDNAGNVGVGRDTTVAVYKSLSHVASSTTVFYPQDLDKYARTARFAFDLSASATISGVIRNQSGDVVRTMFDAVSMAAGTHLFDWDGRLTNGSMAPRGTYTAAISATDGVLSTTGLAPVVADGFRITVNDSTPGRGQAIVLYATSAEPLRTLPGVKISQPGTSAFSVTMTRTGTYTYRVTVRLKRAGRAGSVRFSFSGVDGSGGINRATRTFVLH
jgi:flagellar hook assembly protein FlgD